MRRVWIAVVLMTVLAAGGIAYRSFMLRAAEPPAGPSGAPTVPVVVAPVTRKAVAVRVDAIGTVQPIASVVVKSRVDGEIAEVKVSDGQTVTAGDALIVLDTRSIEAQIKQAEATLGRDRIQLENSKRDVERFRPLTQKEFYSRQQFDLVETTAAAREATVKADEATLANYKVQLTYYTIRSPIDGRLGTVALKVGNAVKANDIITLATINQIKPIYVSCSVPQRELPGIRAALAAGRVPVEARHPGLGDEGVTGRLDYFDNQVDAATGTIALKAIFDNADERLWPGEFVNVSVILRVEPDAIVVPGAAVQVGQNGTYVFVVKSDNTVELRPVTVDRTIDNESVIAKGLAEGDRVVIDGQLRLTNGSRVEIRTSAGTRPGTERRS